uniref:ABC transporter ATP-binding protein n=1 Tax=Candidatus Aschnera chinzeii TaxID=1485666 RepID=A0AAT9G4Y4_9ENTR|nr:MAG: ABC transporter ATP-binding protein [Candidatus Aschnera chinzeii]
MSYALKIQQLKKIYDKEKIALFEVNLNIKIGDFYALLGPNGAGKSTLIGIISSLIYKTSGNIKIFGLDLDKNHISVKRILGLVPQEFNFNPFETVLQIVINHAGYYGIPSSIALLRAKKYLTRLSLWNKRNDIARNLSGGMKRCLMIVRALMHKPKLLILDEPTSGVDIEIRKIMWKYFKYLNLHGTTIILTTHYFEEAEQLCRHIGIIKSGRLIINTSMKNLLNQLEMETFIFEIENYHSNLTLTNYHYNILDTSTIEVIVDKRQGLNDLLNQLLLQNIKIISIRNKINRLEELFIHLTNKK